MSKAESHTTGLYDQADARYSREGIIGELQDVLSCMEKDGSRSIIFGRPLVAAILDHLERPSLVSSEKALKLFTGETKP